MIVFYIKNLKSFLNGVRIIWMKRQLKIAKSKGWLILIVMTMMSIIIDGGNVCMLKVLDVWIFIEQ